MTSRKPRDARYYAKNQLRQQIYQQLMRLANPDRMAIYSGLKYQAERLQRRIYDQLLWLAKNDSD